MLSLSSIDKFISRISFLNVFVNELATMFVPSTFASAACPDGWFERRVTVLKKCWASGLPGYCPGTFKCVKVTTYTYLYYGQPSCDYSLYKCLSATCPGGTNTECQ